MTEFRVRKNKNEQVLSISGDLTIQSAAKFKEACQKAINRSNQIVFRLKQVTDCDLAGLQILCAAFKTAAAQKKKLILQDEPECLLNLIKDTGYSRESACIVKNGKNCLWAAGGVTK